VNIEFKKLDETWNMFKLQLTEKSWYLMLWNLAFLLKTKFLIFEWRWTASFTKKFFFDISVNLN